MYSDQAIVWQDQGKIMQIIRQFLHHSSLISFCFFSVLTLQVPSYVAGGDQVQSTKQA
jgi:hypothetical protein